jgi:hypothetical protein
LFKRIAIGFGIVLGLLLIVNGVLAWMAQHRFDQLIAKLRDAGEPTSLADLAPNPIAPEKNAAVYLQQIEPQLERFVKEHAEFYETAEGIKLNENKIKGLLPNRAQQTAIHQILDAFPTILPTIEKASGCERYAAPDLDFRLTWGLFLERLIDQVRVMRQPSEFVREKMSLLVAEGKSDEAVRLGIRMLRLSRLY